MVMTYARCKTKLKGVGEGTKKAEVDGDVLKYPHSDHTTKEKVSGV